MTEQIEVLVVFILTYLGIALAGSWKKGKGLSRPAVAMMGAGILLLLGVISLEDAVDFIDFNTITLLFGMMIVIGGLQHSGCLTQIAKTILNVAKSRFMLLVIIVLV